MMKIIQCNGSCTERVSYESLSISSFGKNFNEKQDVLLHMEETMFFFT